MKFTIDRVGGPKHYLQIVWKGKTAIAGFKTSNDIMKGSEAISHHIDNFEDMDIAVSSMFAVRRFYPSENGPREYSEHAYYLLYYWGFFKLIGIPFLFDRKLILSSCVDTLRLDLPFPRIKRIDIKNVIDRGKFQQGLKYIVSPRVEDKGFPLFNFYEAVCEERNQHIMLGLTFEEMKAYMGRNRA